MHTRFTARMGLLPSWSELSAGAHVLWGAKVAYWWDPRIQDWGTSPNAPEDWPAPAKDPEDIRARLEVVLEGAKVRYWHGRDHPDGEIHWEATTDEWIGTGKTRDAAYLDIWPAMVAHRPYIR